jgi:hypothetical protein
MVWGLFLDGKAGQQPMVCGTWHGEPKDKSDVSGYATGDKKIAKGNVNMEPANQAAPVYPHNKVHTTKSGHVIEVDDTPGASRIHLFHKSGSYIEMVENGDGIVKVVGDSYDITVGEKKIHVGGKVTIEIGGNADVKVKGAVKLSASSVEITEG